MVWVLVFTWREGTLKQLVLAESFCYLHFHTCENASKCSKYILKEYRWMLQIKITSGVVKSLESSYNSRKTQGFSMGCCSHSILREKMTCWRAAETGRMSPFTCWFSGWQRTSAKNMFIVCTAYPSQNQSIRRDLDAQGHLPSSPSSPPLRHSYLVWIWTGNTNRNENGIKTRGKICPEQAPSRALPLTVRDWVTSNEAEHLTRLGELTKVVWN